MRRTLIASAILLLLVSVGCNNSKPKRTQSSTSGGVTSGTGGVTSGTNGGSGPVASTGPVISASARIAPQTVGLALRLSNGGADPLSLSAITISAAGSIDESTAIGGLALIGDDNGNGAIEQGEPSLGSRAAPAFAADDGSAAITLTTPVTIAPGASLNLIVAAELSPTGAAAFALIGKTLDLSVAAAADIVATSNGQAATIGGSYPLGGAPVTLFLHDHLLITELVVSATAEYMEIANPTAQTVDLSTYYLSEQQDYNGVADYYRVPQGAGFDPRQSTDYIVRFPAGATIAPGQVITVAVLGAEFAADYGQAADYAVVAGGGAVQMLHADQSSPAVWSATPNFTAPLLVRAENVVLFTWDGQSDLVKDVDVVQPGPPNTTNHPVDKGNVSIDGPDAGTTPSTYPPETPLAQRAFTLDPPAAAGTHALQRIDFTETGEVTANGSGITGHDETSEPVDTTFILGAPTPGQP